MNLLESLVNIDISYELSVDSAIKLIPEMMELVLNDDGDLSEAQIERFNQLAELLINEEVIALSDEDTSFLIGLYLILKS